MSSTPFFFVVVVVFLAQPGDLFFFSSMHDEALRQAGRKARDRMSVPADDGLIRPITDARHVIVLSSH